MKELIRKFLTDNSWQYRLARTIIQGLIGVLIANVGAIVEAMSISSDLKPIIVALVMAVLSPIMSELGKLKTFNSEEVTNE